MTISQEISSSAAARTLEDAIARLQSPQEGAQSVVDIVRFGPQAIPALRGLLFGRDRSGLHQARCRAIDALAALKAYDVLDEFLRRERPIGDPTEELGEDVVVSAAARALARRHDKASFALLEGMARRRPLAGILAGLGSYKRLRTIPIFVKALAEDELRFTVEAVLRSFGSRARPHLLAAACDPAPDVCESDFRKRRSVLGLLGEMRKGSLNWTCLKPLMASSDLETAILAAGLGLKFGSEAERQDAAHALRTLRPQADWLRRMQIDQYLQRFEAKGVRGRQSIVRRA